MSCYRCLSFQSPRCLLWDEDVPSDHRETGCDQILRDDTEESFERAFRQAKTTLALWTLTYRWKGEKVSEALWDAYIGRERQLVKGGQKPCVFYARLKEVHRWCLTHLSLSEHDARPIDTADVARESMMGLMTEDQATECLEDLYKEGILKMTKTRKKESLFWVEAK